MAQATRTFRIFVSSTFADLKAERNALQEHVFPKLREFCAQKGARFQTIDLRWGISAEAAFDQQTLPICLAEIDRCQRMVLKPNFVVLLGDRYGWRPLPAVIPAHEFEEIEGLITAAETRLLETWYRRDDNARPPVYDLQPREEKFHPQTVWEERVEGPLREILLRASAHTMFTDEARLKYGASATEQEIERGAMLVPNAHEHVFAFLRELKTDGGRRLADDLPPGETAKAFADLLPGGGLDVEARERLERLKDVLRARLPGNVHDYEATWAKSGISTDHIGKLPKTLHECLDLLDDQEAPKTLCVDVWKELATVIRGQLDRLGPAAGEAEIHKSFADERAAVFVGRNAILGDIEDYLAGSNTNICVIVGAPGSGKSALLAKAAEEARTEHLTAAIVARYIGASPGSSDIRNLLGDLCLAISDRYGDDTPVPTEYQELAAELPKRLALASAEQPLVLFVDALDQLSDSQGARNLVWLPASLPEHVRVVVSTRHELLEPLRAKHPKPDFLPLDRLSRGEGDELLGKWLEATERTLQPDQRKHVLDAFHGAGGMPLYLKLAFEEARLWKSHTPLEPLGADIPGIIRDNLFARLAEEEHHGALLVERSLAYLAASRYGLAEDELLDVLARDDELYEHVKGQAQHELPEGEGERRLPVVLWSRLSFDLEAYLTERLTDGASLLDFYHRELGDVAAMTYLAEGAAERRHTALAGYFRSKTDPEGDGSWTGTDTRGLSEVPYHLAHADGREEELFKTLTDFRFLERKAVEVGVVEQGGEKLHTGVFQLQDDFDLALAKLGGDGTAAGRRPLIVIAVDFGDGFVVRCPWCNTSSSFQDEWRGNQIPCPKCKGPLRVNPFVVGKTSARSRKEQMTSPDRGRRKEDPAGGS